MCDTMVIGENETSVFGKNSDRDPEEIQILQYSVDGTSEMMDDPCPERLPKYIEGPYRNLMAHAQRWTGTYPALISRPGWIWGAEMGVNIHGLAIGNEAVFSREKPVPGGLLGMDILRLALSSCCSARDAVIFIGRIIREIGQGGNGSYTGKLEYHNSFLIKDPTESFILETSGRHWVYRKVKGSGSISNAYTIKEEFDGTDADTRTGFRGTGENPIFTLFARGRTRQAFTSGRLASSAPDVKAIKDILRSHPSGSASIRKNMTSVCMHSRGIVSSETTASMIVEYRPGGFVVWVTGSPFPCVSLFKPLVFNGLADTPFCHIETAVRYAEEAAVFSRRALRTSTANRERIRQIAEEYEGRFETMIASADDPASACAACWALEDDFRREAGLSR